METDRDRDKRVVAVLSRPRFHTTRRVSGYPGRRRFCSGLVCLSLLALLWGRALPAADLVSPYIVWEPLAGNESESGSTNGTGSAARFDAPMGLAVNSAGMLYVADVGNNTIRQVTPAGVVTTLAGTPGTDGWSDGTGGAAQFSYPQGVALDATGTLYVMDTGNQAIRKVTPAGVVTTLAAGPWLEEVAEIPISWQFPYSAEFLAVDGAGTAYMADPYDQTLWKVTRAGVLSALAGSSEVEGSDDGTGSAARFNWPEGLAVDSAGNLYVADSSNSTIRKVTPAGVVTTLAGSPGIAGWTDGTGSEASFEYPYGLAMGAGGHLLVLEYYGGIRKVTPAGLVTTFDSVDGNGAPALLSASGIATDAAGHVYVSTGHCILKGTLVYPQLMAETPSLLPPGCPGLAYRQVLQAVGGTLPYAWTVSSGRLPAGLTLSSSGVISGTPKAEGSTTFTVQVSDSQGAVATQELSLDIKLLWVTFTAAEGGSVSRPEPQGVKTGGSTAAVKATPRKGWYFTGWTDESETVVSVANPWTVRNVTADAQYTAQFRDAHGLLSASLSASHSQTLKTVVYPGEDGYPGFTERFVVSTDRYGLSFTAQMDAGWDALDAEAVLTIMCADWGCTLALSEADARSCRLNGPKGGAATWTAKEFVETNPDTGAGRNVVVERVTVRWNSKGVLSVVVTGTPLVDAETNILMPDSGYEEPEPVTGTAPWTVSFGEVLEAEVDVPWSGKTTVKVVGWTEPSGEPGEPGYPMEEVLWGWSVKGAFKAATR